MKKKDLEHLIVNLRNKTFFNIHTQAVEAIDLAENSEIIKMIIHTLNNEDKETRIKIIHALGETRDINIVKPLIPMLGDLDEDVQRAALTVIVNMGMQAIDILMATMQDGDPHIRKRTREALARIEGSSDGIILPSGTIRDETRVIREKIEAILLSDQIEGDIKNFTLRMLGNKDVHIREKTVEILGEIGDQRTIEPLIKALDGESRGVQDKIVSVLIKFGGSAIDPLIKALDTNEDIREKVVHILGKIGDVKAVEPIIKMLTDPDKNVFKEAVSALGRIGKPCIAPLINASNSGEIIYRWRAVEALGRLDGEAVMARLTRALEDKEGRVREAAVGSIARIKGEYVIDHLIKGLNDPDENVRIKTAKSLGRTGNIKAIEPLIKLLSDGSLSVQESAAESLGLIGDEKGVDSLICVLTSKNPKILIKAAQSLGLIGDIKAVKPLITILDIENPKVKSTTANSLGQIRDEKAIDPLINLLSNDDKNVRNEAAEALISIGKQVVEPLILALKNGDTFTREKAVEILGIRGKEKVVELLIHSLTDKEETVREKAAEALGRTGDARAVSPLLGTLKDENQKVREKTARSLGQLKSEDSIDPLIQALNDENIDVRDAAKTALLRTGKSTVEPLLQALRGVDINVQKRAKEVLSNIKEPESVEIVVKALENKTEYPGFRKELTDVLGMIGNPEIWDSLKKAARDEDPELREMAKISLKRLKVMAENQAPRIPDCPRCSGPLRQYKKAVPNKGRIFAIIGVFLIPLLCIGIPVFFYGFYIVMKNRGCWICRYCGFKFAMKWYE